MARRKIKKGGLGNNKLLFEVAVGIVALVLLFGVLNTVTHTSETELITTEDLKNCTLVMYYTKVNTSTGLTEGSVYASYQLSDIAVLKDGYLYVAFPYDVEVPAGYDLEVVHFGIYLNKTFKDLIDLGWNGYEVEFQLVNSSALPSSGTMYLGLDEAFADAGHDEIAIESRWENYLNLSNMSSVPAKYEGDVDPAELLITASSILDKEVMFCFEPLTRVWTPGDGQYRTLDGFILKLNIYTASEKPVLKAFTEPIWAFMAGLWSTLLAVYNRVRQYIGSFVGGFSVSAFFTGLIGDPVTAAIISAIMIAVFFFALVRPAPRRSR
ncbi:hypothetical protein Asulf_00944 [Archaeoglobus sulfaticallidus PM70-1]|uniref:Uncharacterized protein n=1 Tax=Archaeoglobus sulfaticallidus PM70-1 TaxID=387631 RepID=N0BD63_9EURY|nr:hypothetical protein [Archaeoglobus sulfaticallidus]AGK60948.1 hypothetical protein Asulf_00944 [Archaeoglobus sulfaticallidus PM70-1]